MTQLLVLHLCSKDSVLAMMAEFASALILVPLPQRFQAHEIGEA